MAGTATARGARIRPRPAPRRGGGPSRIQWERLGRVALLGVLCVIVLLYIPPVTHWIQQSQTASRGHAQLADLKRERARLDARLHELTGPGALEREARRLGMVKPGERPFVILGPPSR
jgi:cell division protein FtsB